MQPPLDKKCKLFCITLHYKEGEIMDNLNKETITKTMRFEKELADKIQELAIDSKRDFTKQVKFMLSEYLKMKENK